MLCATCSKQGHYRLSNDTLRHTVGERLISVTADTPRRSICVGHVYPGNLPCINSNLVVTRCGRFAGRVVSLRLLVQRPMTYDFRAQLLLWAWKFFRDSTNNPLFKSWFFNPTNKTVAALVPHTTYRVRADFSLNEGFIALVKHSRLMKSLSWQPLHTCTIWWTDQWFAFNSSGRRSFILNDSW